MSQNSDQELRAERACPVADCECCREDAYADEQDLLALDDLFGRAVSRIDRHDDGSVELVIACVGTGTFRYRWGADGHYVGYECDGRPAGELQLTE